jgi:hypothetical protein
MVAVAARAEAKAAVEAAVAEEEEASEEGCAEEGSAMVAWEAVAAWERVAVGRLAWVPKVVMAVVADAVVGLVRAVVAAKVEVLLAAATEQVASVGEERAQVVDLEMEAVGDSAATAEVVRRTICNDSRWGNAHRLKAIRIRTRHEKTQATVAPYHQRQRRRVPHPHSELNVPPRWQLRRRARCTRQRRQSTKDDGTMVAWRG